MPIIKTYMVPHPPLIIPDIGKGGEEQIKKTTESYETVAKEISEIKPDTIIISSPHTIMYGDYFHITNANKVSGDFSNFNASNISFEEEQDIELIEEIENISKKYNFPAGRTKDIELDHGTMIPLYFIRKYYKEGKIIVLGPSGLPLIDNYMMGIIIKEAVNNLNKKVVYIASGDLSHKLQPHGPYGFCNEGVEYDKRIMEVCSNANFNELLNFEESFLDKAAECGHRSFTIMAGTLDGLNVKAEYLSHEDITGVGYGIITFTPQDKNDNRYFLDNYFNELEEKLNKQKQNEDPYVKLARLTIEEYITNKNVLETPSNTPKELLNSQAGVFVSIHKFGSLRGCIGTIMPTTNSIAQEIITNAISASTKDPRFPKIEKEELDYLEINVDVLGEPEDIDSEEQLNVKEYGVIVTSGMKRGLLLPDLDGVDTVSEQISIAKKKAGIKDEPYTLQRFKVTRHK
ncbi:MAG: AmmeMemoRadiSam system protein A [Firmicutes bacterium]|nr:AmmeMemoRadiSam system protein A [Bacillota bacterium]